MIVINLYKSRFLNGLGILLLFLCSCNINRISETSKKIDIPDSFNADTSSLSIADLSPKDFFTDTTLHKLIDSALINNPDLSIAAERIAIAQSDVLLKRAPLLPSINANVTAGIDKYGKYTMNGVGNFDTNLSPNISGDQKIPSPTPDLFVGFQSYWEIDIWGKLKNRKHAAMKRLLASEKGRQTVITSLVADIAILYYRLLSLNGKMDILRKNIELQEQGLQMIEIQKEGGKVTQLAVEQFSAQLLNTKSEEKKVYQQIVETETKINYYLGRYPQSLPLYKTIEDQIFPKKINSGIPSKMLLRRPDIQQAELNLEANDLEVKAARQAFLPSLTISPYAGINAFKPEILINPASFAFGFISGLSMPLFNRRALKANYQNRMSNKKISLIEYKKSILVAYGEVINHLKGIDNYQQIYQYKDEQTQRLQHAASTANDLFMGGYASYLEVIIAQKNVLDAEIELIDARNSQFIMLVNLYRSLGGGWR